MGQYFFSDPSEIPEEMLWEVYGPEHIAWLVGIAAVCALACVLFGGWYAVVAAVLLVVVLVILFLSWSVSARERR